MTVTYSIKNVIGEKPFFILNTDTAFKVDFHRMSDFCKNNF